MKFKILMTTLLAVLLVGCSSNNTSKSGNQDNSTSSQSTSQSSHSQSSSSQATDKAALSQVKVSVATAIKQFNQTFANTDITGISVEKELGTYQWDIEGVDDNQEHSLKINAQTGKVLSKHSEALDADEANGSERQEALKLDQLVSLQRAVKIAQGSVKDQTPTEASVDKESGQTYWEVQFEHQGTETSVKLNAQTGKVLEVEHDD